MAGITEAPHCSRVVSLTRAALGYKLYKTHQLGLERRFSCEEQLLLLDREPGFQS